MKFNRPKITPKRVGVAARVDEEIKMTLEMLGFDIPSMIEELLKNVADKRRCPCCGREVKPLIVGRNVQNKSD